MAERLSIQIKDEDNVVVAVHDLPAGTTLESGVVTWEPIPQAHKIALRDIPAGGEILRYGVVLGYAKNDISAGSWINEHMLNLPESPARPICLGVRTSRHRSSCLLRPAPHGWATATR